MAWCEENQVDYLFGLARNSRLQEAIRPELARAKALSTSAASRPSRTSATAPSWSRQRRVVAKAEVLPRGPNPRFVVTSLSAHNHPLSLQRLTGPGRDGKPHQGAATGPVCDRTSTHTFRANQLRLSLTAVAYVLMEGLRRDGLKHTCLARATVGSLG